MEAKKECLVVDADTGEFFRTPEDLLKRTAKELDEIVKKDGYFTYKDMMEIITKDWPEDKKAEFFGRLNRHEGWTVNGEEAGDLRLDYAKAKNSDDVIFLRFDCD